MLLYTGRAVHICGKFIPIYIYIYVNAAIFVLAFCTSNLFLNGANATFHWEHQTFLLQQGLLQAKNFQ